MALVDRDINQLGAYLRYPNKRVFKFKQSFPSTRKIVSPSRNYLVILRCFVDALLVPTRISILFPNEVLEHHFSLSLPIFLDVSGVSFECLSDFNRSQRFALYKSRREQILKINRPPSTNNDRINPQMNPQN